MAFWVINDPFGPMLIIDVSRDSKATVRLALSDQFAMKHEQDGSKVWRTRPLGENETTMVGTTTEIIAHYFGPTT